MLVIIEPGPEPGDEALGLLPLRSLGFCRSDTAKPLMIEILHDRI